MSTDVVFEPVVLALSNQDEGGVFWNGPLTLKKAENESLADAVVRTLREREVDIQPGDHLYFPDAARGWRLVDVGPEGVTHRAG